jgi:alkylated DNA repair dioxygenase AlkB
VQFSLFGSARPRHDAQFEGAVRRDLGQGAWLEHLPSWVSGHETLFRELEKRAAWRQQSRMMYERRVMVPRLVAEPPPHGASVELLAGMSRALSARYGRDLGSIVLAYYRDGRDSVAPHGDKMGPLIPDCVIAIVSLGEPRRFILRQANGSLALRYHLGWGDLLVMGGSCQKHFMHGVPKVEHASPRMSIQFRERIPEEVRHPARLYPSSPVRALSTPARQRMVSGRR